MKVEHGAHTAKESVESNHGCVSRSDKTLHRYKGSLRPDGRVEGKQKRAKANQMRMNSDENPGTITHKEEVKANATAKRHGEERVGCFVQSLTNEIWFTMLRLLIGNRILPRSLRCV